MLSLSSTMNSLTSLHLNVARGFYFPDPFIMLTPFIWVG